MNKRNELISFLGLTFGLTYIVEYIGLSRGGLIGGTSLGLTHEATLALQFAMFIPALVAIVMNRFITKSSVYVGKAKWFINYYLVLTAEIFIGFIAVSVLGLHEANPAILQIIGAVTGVTGLIGTILLVALNIKPAWRADLEKAKLHFGSPRNYIIYAGLIAVFVTVGAYIDSV